LNTIATATAAATTITTTTTVKQQLPSFLASVFQFFLAPASPLSITLCKRQKQCQCV